jgi:hypothetical protein
MKKKPPLLQKLHGDAAKKYGTLPKILLPGDNSMQRTFNESLSYVFQNNTLFRRSILPVVPVDGRLMKMTPDHFITFATEFCMPYKIRYDRDGDPVEVYRDMTKSHATQCIDSLEFIFSLPPIERLYPCPVPVISHNILTLITPGYNPLTATYVFDSAIEKTEQKEIPPHLSHLISSSDYYDDSIDLSAACRYLYSILKDFPFSDWEPPFIPTPEHPLYQCDAAGNPLPIRLSRSLSVQIGAMLSIFAGNCVPQLASRMGFMMIADQQRSGKTLLVKLATIPVHGAFKAQSWRSDDENLIKILDSETLAASPYICFDNARAYIESPALEGFMTSPTWTGRILGKTEMFTAENNATIFITGNGLKFCTDIGHRFLIVDLYVEESDIQGREITTVIDDMWLSDLKNRRDILNSLWCIVRHWEGAGRPDAVGKPYRGFDRWCKVIGGMVDLAGFGDMLHPPKLENSGDGETDDINALVALLYTEKNGGDYTTAEVAHLLWTHGLLTYAMSGKEDYKVLRDGSPGVHTLILDSKSNSKIGLILQRHCKGERGSLHTVNNEKVRFFSRGKGNYRRYYVEKHVK